VAQLYSRALGSLAALKLPRSSYNFEADPIENTVCMRYHGDVLLSVCFLATGVYVTIQILSEALIGVR
jgi:hypothetical protein